MKLKKTETPSVRKHALKLASYIGVFRGFFIGIVRNMSTEQKGEASPSKRPLDEDVGDDEPPKKKQRMCQNGNKDNSKTEVSNEKNENKEQDKKEKDQEKDKEKEKSKEKVNGKREEDVRTIPGYDRPTHFEILASNPEKIMDFYTKVFEWKFTPMHMKDSKYWGIQTGPYQFGKNPQQALATYGVAGGLAVREGMLLGDSVICFILFLTCSLARTALKMAVLLFYYFIILLFCYFVMFVFQ